MRGFTVWRNLAGARELALAPETQTVTVRVPMGGDYISRQIERTERMTAPGTEALGRKAKARMEEAYRWQMVADRYARLWRDAAEAR